MRACESCGRVRFYSLNFLFSSTVCNECYMNMKERQEKGRGVEGGRKEKEKERGGGQEERR